MPKELEELWPQIVEWPPEIQQKLIDAIRAIQAEYIDGEHDFVSFEHCNRTFFWKCDYYDKEMDGGSEDPADPDKTTRVGTLMLAEDY